LLESEQQEAAENDQDRQTPGASGRRLVSDAQDKTTREMQIAGQRQPPRYSGPSPVGGIEVFDPDTARAAMEPQGVRRQLRMVDGEIAIVDC
jgi:hypothetical protein